MQLSITNNNLLAALERVRVQHPIRRGEKVETSKTIVDEVRDLLERTELNKLNKLSFQFDLIKLLACVEIVANDRDGDIADKAATVASLRPRDAMLIKGWFKLVSFYPNLLLEKLLKHLIENLGFSALENHEKVSKHIPHWFLADKLSSGILRDYNLRSNSATLDQYMSEHLFSTQDGLYSTVWFELLTKGTRSDLIRQVSRRILVEMHNRQKASERIEIGQHYLNTLNNLDEWHENILKYILAKWGKPNSPHETQKKESRFWSLVHQSAKDEFRRWLMLEEVETFFEGERADFWRHYVNSKFIRDVNNILGGEGFMLDFGHFGVIEFKNVGNAAYIYPREIFRKFWSSAEFWTNSPSHFKELSKTVRSKRMSGWDGRILHHAGWEYTSKDRINTLMAEK